MPNLLRRLFAEGAFAQAFVPILAEYRRKRGVDATRLLVGNVGTLLAIVLIVLSVLGSLAAPWLVYLLAGGFARTPGKVELTAEMIRIVFPYILFVSLVSLAGGVLNVFRRFAIPAFTPVMLNLSIIGAAIFLAPYVDPPILALAWGVAIGGLAQLALQIRPLLAIGMLPKPGFDWRDEGVRRVLLAMGPAVIGVSAAQISALINTQLAALLGDGRISWITYADRLMEFPSALLGVALGTILLPSLAQHHSDADQRGVFGAARLGVASRVAARAAGRGRARDPRAAARVDALPVRPIHRQRRDADARRAARLQRGPAGADPREDPRARFLCAAGDGHAGEDRVRHRARHANARCPASRGRSASGRPGSRSRPASARCFNAGLLLWLLLRRGLLPAAARLARRFSPRYASPWSLLAVVDRVGRWAPARRG